MRFKPIVLLAVSILSFVACSKKEEPKPQQMEMAQGKHNVYIQEVQQVSQYSYLKVKEGDKEYWIATTKGEFAPGQALSYAQGMEMKNFESKELKRKFDSILFVDQMGQPSESSSPHGSTQLTPQKPAIEKMEVKVPAAKGGITIAQLFSNLGMYADKSVIISGKVTKVNNGIMKKNWIHIQDGTSSGSDFDLTVTTLDQVNVGDVVTVQGKIALNKDFGYGYSYKVLLEDAKVQGGNRSIKMM